MSIRKDLLMPRRTEIPHHRNSKQDVQRILSQERYYGDGPPRWLEGKNKRPSQTAADAQSERRKTLKRLRRFGKENDEALELASRLEACEPKQRCGSGACPECARAWQRWFVTATRSFLKSERRESVTVLNPIHVSGKIEPGSLCDPGVLKNAREAIRVALVDAGILRGFFGLDVSFNEDREGEFDPHWQLHLRGLIVGRISKPRRERFWSHFPKTKEIPKPRRSAEFDGDLSGIAYSMKPQFWRRQGYLDEKESRNTRDRPLRGVEAVELALFLNRIGLRARLMLGGSRLTELENGDVGIERKPKHPQPQNTKSKSV
jgi:hypothetical protein